MMFYVLIDKNGIEVKETNKMLSSKEMQNLVGIPGQSALTEVVWYQTYSDPAIKMIGDEEFIYGKEEGKPTCLTTTNEPVYGQLLIVASDPKNGEEFGLLTSSQVEIVQKETVFCDLCYILINAKGIEIIEATEMLTRKEIELLVGVPGKDTLMDVIENQYSDPKIRILIDDSYEPPNSQQNSNKKTNPWYDNHGQVLVLAINDQNSEGFNVLTKAQVEIVQKETIFYHSLVL